MKRYEQLQEQYEEALLALLMEEAARNEGEKLLEENERLKHAPEITIPKAVLRRGRRTIHWEFSKRNAAAFCQTSGKGFQRVAVFAFAAILLFTGVFAASEDFRLQTLNLIVEVFESHTNFRFSQISESTNNYDFEIGWLPEDFTLVEQNKSYDSSWVNYKSSKGEFLYIDLAFLGNYGSANYDTENATAEEITINDSSATLYTKNYYQIVLPIPEKKQILWVAMECKVSETKKAEC